MRARRMNALHAPRSSFRGAAGTCRTRTRNLGLFSAKHAEIPGSSARRRAAARNDSLGPGQRLNIFSYIPLTTSPSGLYSPSSCPTERGDRDRHVSGVGCGGRRRCGVTRFGGDVCLRAGRICASTATGKETADLGMERLSGQCDGRPKSKRVRPIRLRLPSHRLGTLIR